MKYIAGQPTRTSSVARHDTFVDDNWPTRQSGPAPPYPYMGYRGGTAVTGNPSELGIGLIGTAAIGRDTHLPNVDQDGTNSLISHNMNLM